MKRGFTLILFLLAFLSISAQDVVQEQRTLLTKKTASWCPYCGTWGWTFMKNIITDNEEKAVIIGAHYSGDLRSQAAADLTSMFGGGGQPVFYSNGQNLGVSSGNISSKRSEVEQLVNDHFNESPVANTGLDIFDRAGQLDINARVEFFQAASGTYKVAIWVLENDVVNNQAGQGPNAMHPYVFRAAVNGVTGEEIASGSIAAGTVVDLDLSFTPDASWDMDNLSFAAVIWKENGADHEFVNVFSEDEIQISTSSEDHNGSLDFSVQPSILRSKAELKFELDQPREIAIMVHDLIGSEVKSYSSGRYEAGIQTVELNRDDFNGRGMYLITLSSEGEVLTKRILVE